MSPEDFFVASRDEGHDIGEGELAYRVEERRGKYLVVEYLADDPIAVGSVVDAHDTPEQAQAFIRDYVRTKERLRLAATGEDE